LFDAVTTDDIVIAINNSGRTAFANVPRTGRQGAEISMQSQLPYNLQFSAAYTVVKAQVSQAYTQFNGVVVNSGSRIPGVPGQGLFGELMWRKPDRALEFAVEARAAGSIAANDLNTEYAGGYGLLNLRVVARQPVGRWAISEFARVDNLLDRNYVGSLIVNQASRQYYESAPGRNWLAGVRASYMF
jgi:iron complex outermembrane receptor protein